MSKLNWVLAALALLIFVLSFKWLRIYSIASPEILITEWGNDMISISWAGLWLTGVLVGWVVRDTLLWLRERNKQGKEKKSS